MRQPDIAAIVSYQPMLTYLLNGGAHRLFDSNQIPGEIIDVLVVREHAVRKHRSHLPYLLRAWFIGRQHMLAQQTQALAQMQARQQLLPVQLKQTLRELRFPTLEENRRLLGQPSQLPATGRQLQSLRIAACRPATGQSASPAAALRPILAAGCTAVMTPATPSDRPPVRWRTAGAGTAGFRPASSSIGSTPTADAGNRFAYAHRRTGFGSRLPTGAAEIAHGDTTDIQTSIANLTASGNYRTIALLDQQDRVLAASRLDADEAADPDAGRRLQHRAGAQRGESGHHNVHFSADQSLVQAYMPISVHRDKLATQLQSVSLLYVEYDLGPLRREQRQQAALHMAASCCCSYCWAERSGTCCAAACSNDWRA